MPRHTHDSGNPNEGDDYKMPGAPLEIIKRLNILVDLYNLRIEPNLSPDTTRILNDRDKCRILRFLQRNANFDIARLKGRGYIEYTDVPKGRRHGERLINQALEKYQQEKGMDWFESEDFRRLIDIYQMTRKTIDDLLSNRYHPYIRKCLTQLWCDLEKSRLERELTQVKSNLETLHQQSPFTVENGEKETPLDEITFCEIIHLYSPFPRGWQVLEWNHIGESVYESLITILEMRTGTKRQFLIKRCKLPDCNRIFSLLTRNAKQKVYCSGSCRVKVYQHEKKNLRANRKLTG